jgi:hypothetical protein
MDSNLAPALNTDGAGAFRLPPSRRQKMSPDRRSRRSAGKLRIYLRLRLSLIAACGVDFGVLTYMSIRDEINARLNEMPPRLFTLERSLPSDPVSRSMFLSEEIKNLLDGPWARDDRRYRAGRLRADLEEFIKGEEITLCFEPFAAKTAYMGRLCPIVDSVWDIRSRDPSPALRVVGFFAEMDAFVALRWAPRSRRPGWTDKPPLGDRDSSEWRDIIVQCKTDWKNLFHTYLPVTGECINAYVSDSAHAV